MLSIPLLGYQPKLTQFAVPQMLDARAGGMGGAYAGVSDTLIGAYYNPAGLAFIEQNRKSESSNIFHTKELNYSHLSSEFTYSQQSQSTIPPLVSYFQKLNKFNVAFSVITLNSASFNKDATQLTDVATIHENLDAQATHRLIGPSLAMMISDNIAVGGSLFFSHDSRQMIQNAFSTITGAPEVLQIWTNRYTEETMHELLGIAGIQWMPTTQLSIGVKCQVPYKLSGDGDEQEITGSIDHIGKKYSSIIADNTYDLKSLGYQSNVSELRFGVGFFMSESAMLSLDLNALFPKNTSNYPARRVVSVHLGGEYYMTPYNPVRFGVYSNPSTLPSGADGDHLNGMGIGASVGHEFGKSRLGVGLDYSWAKGNRTKSGQSTYNVSYSELSLLLSASSSF